MSTIKIDSKKAREFQLDDSDVIWLQAICSDTEQIKAKMIRVGIIAVQKDMFGNNDELIMTKRGHNLLKAICKIERDTPPEGGISGGEDSKDETALEKTLKSIYPKGKKDGTAFYWTEGPFLIHRRLLQFTGKFGSFSDKDIAEATRMYVESFNGDYRYMKLLKYFIFKNDIKPGEDGNNEIQFTSELYNYLTNSEGSAPENRDWTTSMR